METRHGDEIEIEGGPLDPDDKGLTIRASGDGNVAVARPAGLSRERIVERAKAYKVKPTIERVELPWWGPGEHAFVRGMTSRERDDFEASLVEKDAEGEEKITAKNIRAKFLVRTVCSADGTRYFATHEVDLIADLDAKTADALYSKARDLSGLTDADIKEMAKNSERVRSEATSSSSH